MTSPTPNHEEWAEEFDAKDADLWHLVGLTDSANKPLNQSIKSFIVKTLASHGEAEYERGRTDAKQEFIDIGYDELQKAEERGREEVMERLSALKKPWCCPEIQTHDDYCCHETKGWNAALEVARRPHPPAQV